MGRPPGGKLLGQSQEQLARESQSDRGEEGRDQILPDCMTQMDLGHILFLSVHLLTVPTPPQRGGSQTFSPACKMGKTRRRRSLSPGAELGFVGPEAYTSWEER